MHGWIVAALSAVYAVQSVLGDQGSYKIDDVTWELVQIWNWELVYTPVDEVQKGKTSVADSPNKKSAETIAVPPPSGFHHQTTRSIGKLSLNCLFAGRTNNKLVVGVGGAQEEQGQERLALWISQDSHVPWSLRGGTRVHHALLRGRWRNWRRASRQGQPCSCHCFKTHQIGLLCAFVQSRRRPEKWTRTGKWDSRRSVTVDFVCICTLFGLHLLSQDVGGE